MWMLLALAACRDEASPVAAGPRTVPWSVERAPLTEVSPAGRAWKRAIVHLHSPFSHDACDNDPMPGGVPDADCLDDLRAALCTNAIDVAMLTEHPAHAAERPFPDLLLAREGDTVLDGRATRMACPGGASTLLLPGIEDELMPVALDRHVSPDPVAADAIYNGTDADTLAAEIDAGGLVLQAHTEGQDLDTLVARQSAGLAGVELYNLHAMVDPRKRAQDLGLEAMTPLEVLAPFFSGETSAEPDLAFLGFHEAQEVSLARWDALSALAPTVATAGTDAHQNALPMLLSDGERADSYRRMTRWFSNILLVDGDDPQDAEDALAAGRNLVAFEILGTPSGFDVHYGDLEMAGTGSVGGNLVVGCPALSPDTPQDGDAPEIRVRVLRDGQPFGEGCGTFPIAEAGVYRVAVDIVPHHLRGFLDVPTQDFVHAMPWLYSGAFRLR
ncbi:MAG: hypothetical protein RLZZ299_1232 [Pseudomonadota bacterium]|jgi:hypothetical protein